MGRVKFKHAQGGERAIRLRLLALLAPKVQVFRLFSAPDGVVVTTSSDSDTDVIFHDEVQASLADAGFTSVMPPELRTMRSVICFGLDDLAYDNSPEEIKAELEAHHPWLKIKEIYKFPKSRTIKIQCSSTAMAKKVVDSGLLMFSLSIPPTQLRIEIYTPLLACDRCHKIEEHATSGCPQPKTYLSCSECAGSDHTFRECKASFKRCVNCTGDHSARAMRCPIRKAALKEKRDLQRKEKESRGTTSYAQAAHSTHSCPHASATPVASPSLITSCLLCLLQAHLVNAGRPGTFQTTLSEALALNGIADVKLPPDPPSADIMTAISAGVATAVIKAQQQGAPVQFAPAPVDTRDETSANITDAPPSPAVVTVEEIARSPPPAQSPHSHSEEYYDEDEEDEPEAEDDLETEMEEGNLHFSVYRRTSDPLPKNLTYEIFTKGVQQGRYKLCHNATAEKTVAIMIMLRRKPDLITSKCVALSETMFDRATNGPYEHDPTEDRPRETRNRGKNKK